MTRNQRCIWATLFLSMSLMLQACYSLKSTSIDPTVRTYFIPQFESTAENALPNLAPRLTEALKDKIRLESRLLFKPEEPDIELRGTLVDYRITAEAPKPGEITAINRLTIVLAVEYFNNLTQKQVWKRNFQFFYDFSPEKELATVQDEALRVITKQLMEDIFNAAFTDW